MRSLLYHYYINFLHFIPGLEKTFQADVLLGMTQNTNNLLKSTAFDSFIYLNNITLVHYQLHLMFVDFFFFGKNPVPVITSVKAAVSHFRLKLMRILQGKHALHLSEDFSMSKKIQVTALSLNATKCYHRRKKKRK